MKTWQSSPGGGDIPILPLLLLLRRLILVQVRLSWSAVRRLLRPETARWRLAVSERGRPRGVGDVVAAGHAALVLDHAHQHVVCTRRILALRA